MKTRLLAVVLLLVMGLFIVACANEPGIDAHYEEDTGYNKAPDTLTLEPDENETYLEPIDHIFPTMHITTYYDPFIQERTFWHNGTITLTGAPEGLNFEDIDARIRGRGNSTWWRGPDKRPLRFRFREARPMMGSNHAATDWILLANHFDRSLLRNYSALYLGNLLDGLGFTPVPHHIQLYVNGEYMGVYLLTDERNAGPGRMNIVWNEDPSISDFFLELDARAYQTGVLDETFVRVSGLFYDLRYPDDLSPQHVDYVRDFLTAVSHAIRRQSFDEILNLIDLDSFVDFYIVQELYKDIDARDLSTFMYITGTGNERRLFKGPIWDFDLAAGNAGNQPMGYGPEGLYVAEVNYWYRYLMRRPEFFHAVQTRWNEIRHREIAQTIDRIGYVATRYQNEFERNFIRHPDVMGRAQMATPQEILEIDNFMGHVEHLVNWLETRANWLDDILNGRTAFYNHLAAWIESQNHNINIILNGEIQEFDIPPIIFHNRTMLPLQELEMLMAVLHDTEVAITYRYGDLVIDKGGEIFELSVPASLKIRDNIYLPIRTIADAFGYGLRFVSDTHTIYITYP